MMLHTITLFGLLGGIPALKTPGEVARDTAKTSDAITLADGALVVDDAPLATALAGIYRMIDRAVAYSLVLHRLDELEND